MPVSRVSCGYPGPCESVLPRETKQRAIANCLPAAAIVICIITKMKFSVYTALLVAALVGLSSGQQDCAYPTGSDVKNIISQNIIFPTEDNSSTLTIKVSSIHLVCLAHSVERDRYRFISFLAQYSCSGNVNCPSGIVLEQFESECIREWSHVVLGSTEYTRTTDPIANISTSTREDCAFCISPTHSFTVFGLPTDPLTHCSGRIASPSS